MTDRATDNILEEKVDASHLELPEVQAQERASATLSQSRYADLSLTATILKFQKVFFIGLAASTGAM